MNDVERKKMLMYEEILTFLRENRESTTGVQGINSNALKLYRVMDEIRNTEKLVSSETFKRTIKTNESRENLIARLLPIISKMQKFARDNNDVLLKERTKLSQSNLVLYKNYELLNKAILLESLAEKHIQQLKKYGLRSENIAALKNQISEFHTISSDNGTGPNTAAFILEKLFIQADSIITNIDEIIENYVEDEVFYEEYVYVKEQQYEEALDEKDELLYELEEN